jgi:FAD:protein FMN transferase
MLTRTTDAFAYRFVAMASPCEVLIDTPDEALAESLGALAEAEARRVEAKFSRYRADSVIGHINAHAGSPTAVDAETADLLDYAATCHALSDGLFDVTSGVLRRVWRFDGSDNLPTPSAVSAVLRDVGWDKVSWRRPELLLAAGMEIDFGGLGKEYAVDSAARSIGAASDAPVLVNFGGDLRATRPRLMGRAWRAAIESVDHAGAPDGVLVFASGAIATSGDARRFLLKDGVRYSHILNPRTGWPVEAPPRSVTVAAPTCTQAGLLSTLAMLHGADAELFLREEGVQAWVAR